jgi:hypothetical protein
MLAVSVCARNIISSKQQPVVRFCEIDIQNLYCKSLLGFSNSTYYSKYSTVSSKVNSEIDIQNFDQNFFDVNREVTWGGVVLSGSNQVARRQCCETVHDQCISRGVVSDE